MPKSQSHGLLADSWSALTAGASSEVARPPVEIEGSADELVSAYATGEMAVACVGLALASAAALHEQRTGTRPTIRLDARHVAAAVRSERYFEIDGVAAATMFAPLSRFWRSSDGWIRTHANFPWHRDALLQALGVASD